jgi:hypothetical protein
MTVLRLFVVSAACRRLLALALAALACASTPVQAAAHIRIETQQVKTSNGKPAAALLINGSVVVRIAKDEDGSPPLRRVSTAATRLASAYRSGKFVLKTQETDKASRRWVLFLNGSALLVASDQEAKAWGVEPQALAHTWQDNIAAAVKAAPAAPGTAERVPAKVVPLELGGTAAPPSGTVELGSSAVRAAPQPVIDPPAASDVYEPPSATELQTPPKQTGGAVVTGSAPGADVVGNAVASALRSQLKLGLDDPLTWHPSGTDPPPIVITSGQNRSLSVDYTTAAGPGTTTVPRQDIPFSTPRESLTLFSNFPESVYSPQLLYAASLPAGRAARLVYHHQCQVEGGVRFVIRALSPDDPGALHVIPGTAQPDVNTFYIGFKSAENFWANLNGNNGYFSAIPVGGQALLLSQTLNRGYTASGYLKLTNAGTQPLRIEVLALPPGSPLPHAAAAETKPMAHCVFDQPYLAEAERYTAGDPWLYLRLGEARPASATDESVLHGCYGMTHSYEVTLSNPGSAPTVVYVVLRASAGEVKGQFYINGEYVSTPLVAGGEEQVMKEIGLAPGESRMLRIKAIALNGGFYPASVILRETRNP